MKTDRANHIPGRGMGGIGTSGPENTKTRRQVGCGGNVATPAPYTPPSRNSGRIKSQRSARPTSRPIKL